MSLAPPGLHFFGLKTPEAEIEHTVMAKVCQGLPTFAESRWVAYSVVSISGTTGVPLPPSIPCVANGEAAPVENPQAAIAAVFADVVGAVSRRARHNRMQGAEDDIADVEGDLLGLAEAMRSYHHRVEDEVADLLGLSLLWTEVSVQCARAAVDSLTQEPLKRVGPEPIRGAWLLLGSRSVSVAAEILTLVRAGFEPGARARWRTLYELRVHAAVLRLGNRHTCNRYLNHHYEMALRDLDRLPDLTDDQFIEKLDIERKCRDLRRRYGANYKQTYGWANELAGRRSGKSQGLRLPDLEQLAGVEEIARHLRAHHDVHADAYGTHEYHQGGRLVSGPLMKRGEFICGDVIWMLSEIMLDLIDVFSDYCTFQTDPRFRRLDATYAVIAELQTLGHRDAVMAPLRIALRAETRGETVA